MICQTAVRQHISQDIPEQTTADFGLTLTCPDYLDKHSIKDEGWLAGNPLDVVEFRNLA